MSDAVATGFSWTADGFGDPAEVLTCRERTWDAPPSGVALVEVAAAAIGLPDLLMTQGSYPLVQSPPVTPGQEVCGTVVAVGEGSAFAPGDRILGTTQFYTGAGGFATHTYVGNGAAMVAPVSMSDEEAAGFYIGFRTAYTALVARSQMQRDENVLVLGGSGGTGATAISLAKALGARVVAMASTPEKRAFCTELGADAVIDRDADVLRNAVGEHTAGAGFDVVIDPVGGDLADAALKTVARYGRFATIGFASGSWVRPNAIDMAMRNYSVVGVLAAGFSPDEDRDHCAALRELADAGDIRTPLGLVAAMADVPRLVASLGTGAPPGKMVVTI